MRSTLLSIGLSLNTKQTTWEAPTVRLQSNTLRPEFRDKKMTDIRAFFRSKSTTTSIDTHGSREDDDEVMEGTFPFEDLASVNASSRKNKEQQGPTEMTPEEQADQERKVLRNTLDQLRNEEKRLSLLIDPKSQESILFSDDTESGLIESLLKLNDQRFRSNSVPLDPNSNTGGSSTAGASYSTRPLFSQTQNDSILNMFHCLTLTSPISVRSSQEIHTYRFSGLSASTMKGRQVNFLKFSTEIRVDTEDYSVESFSLKITSPFSAQKELNDFLRSCEYQKDISRALYGLSSYSELLIKRYAVFSALSSNYKLSKDGTWPMGHTIAFPLRSDTGIQLFISWRVKLDSGSSNILAEASSDIQAFARPSQSTLAYDKTETFSNLNNVFNSLIQEHGVLNAITTLHDILYN